MYKGANHRSGQLSLLFEEAVQRAKSVFLDVEPKTRRLCFKTIVRDVDGKLSEAFVSRYSPTKNPNTQPYEIKPNEIKPDEPDKLIPTHWVADASNNCSAEAAEARIQFKSRSTKEWLDPLDLQSRK
jgi:hypothetical protein